MIERSVIHPHGRRGRRLRVSTCASPWIVVPMHVPRIDLPRCYRNTLAGAKLIPLPARHICFKCLRCPLAVNKTSVEDLLQTFCASKMKRPLPHQDPDDATSLVRPMLPSSSVRMGNNDKKAPALCRLRTIPLEEGLRRPSTNDTEPPYHVYSQRQKWTIVSLVSLAGCLSPLSSNAYFPAATAIASDLRVTECLIGLTITVYMIVQGIAPLPLGAVSDNKGRRLVIIASLAVFAVINLGLSFTSSYPMLLSLRGLQAAGSAAAVSISAGVIADIVSPNERGKFMGMHVGTKYVL